MSQRDNQSDRAVSAHAEVADIIEEDHAGRTGSIDWFTEQRTDHNVGAARFVDNCGTKFIVLTAEALKAIGQGAGSEVRTSTDHQAGRFSARVGVDDPDSPNIRCHGIVNLCKALPLDRNRINLQYLIGVAVFYGYNMQSSNLSADV